MAFDYFQQQQDDQNDQQGQARQIGPESGVITGNAPQQGQPSPGEKTSSAAFTNLNSYLDANKSLQFGQKVAGRVSDEVGRAEQAQNQSARGFKSAVDQGAVQQDQNILNDVLTAPEKVTNNANELSAFQKMRDAYYQGPNSLSERADLYQPAQQQTDKAYQIAQQTKDEAGRKAYLQEQFGAGAGRNDYSSGQQKLDNFLIQNDPEARAAFQNAWGKAGQAKDRLASLTSALDQYAGKAKADTAATKAATRSALGVDANGIFTPSSYYNTLKQSAANRAKSFNEGAQTALDSVTGRVNRGTVSNEELRSYGITPGENTYGAKPAAYFHLNPAATLETSMTPQERARLNALSQLANQPTLPGTELAGKYDPKNSVYFDRGAFDQAVVVGAGKAVTPEMQAAERELRDAEKGYSERARGDNPYAPNPEAVDLAGPEYQRFKSALAAYNDAKYKALEDPSQRQPVTSGGSQATIGGGIPAGYASESDFLRGIRS